MTKTTPAQSRSFRRFLSWLNQLYKFTVHLAIFGLIGTAIGSYFQYTSWREEKILTRHESELKSAIDADTEIVSALSSVMNLQSMLLYGFTNAEGYEGDPVGSETHSYLSDRANEVHKSYVEARTDLRKNIDALGDKAAFFVDRPTEADSRRTDDLDALRPAPILSDRDELREQQFNCEKHMPGPGKAVLKSQEIDWSSARDQVRTFYYCLEDIHTDLLFVRVWAASSGAEPHFDRQDVATRLASLKSKIRQQGTRLSALMLVADNKIEALRLRELPQGFFRYQFGLGQ